MSTIDFNALTKMAEDAGYSTKELEPGTYTAEVKNANYTEKTNGKAQFGFRFVVVGGPFNGGDVWKNINVPDPRTSTDPQKLAQAAGFFIRDLNALGVDQTVAGRDPEAAAKAVVGHQFEIQVKRDRPNGSGGFWTDVVVKKAVAAADAVQRGVTVQQQQSPPVQQQIPVTQQDLGVPATAAPWQGNRPI